MRAAAAIGLLLAIVMGVLAIPQVSALQDGQALSGPLGEFFANITVLLLIIVAVLMIGTLASVVMLVVRR